MVRTSDQHVITLNPLSQLCNVGAQENFWDTVENWLIDMGKGSSQARLSMEDGDYGSC